MSDKMTVRQIATAAGCNHKTVRTVIDRLYPGRAQNGVRLEFDKIETCAIMQELPKRNMVEEPSQKREADLPESGKLDLAALVRETVAAAVREIVPALVEAVRIASQPAQPLALPPPPELEPRDALRKLVTQYAGTHGRDYKAAWQNLYGEFELRSHRNIRQCAKNRGLDTLDYCENENILGELLALAFSLYGQKESAA
jgi:hypothetical protein